MNINNETIGAAIQADATDIRSVQPDSWTFTWDNGGPHGVTAKFQDNWLKFESECHGLVPSSREIWAALERNASLPGPAKVVLNTEGALRLRSELQLWEGVDLTKRVRETRIAFEAAWKRREDASSASPPLDIKTLCSEAGWPFTERGGQTLAVSLETPGSFHQAILTPAGHGVRICCELARLDSLTDPSRRAVASLLLRASGVVCMARASLGTGEGTQIAQFDVVFESAPTASEISIALESLSVACSICGEAEIKTLQSPVIAERYLALRGLDAITDAKGTCDEPARACTPSARRSGSGRFGAAIPASTELNSALLAKERTNKP